MNAATLRMIEDIASHYAYSQCPDDASWGQAPSPEWQSIRDKKFAELIVQECIKVLETEIGTWKQMDPYRGAMKRRGSSAIKKHFGIEE